MQEVNLISMLLKSREASRLEQYDVWWDKNIFEFMDSQRKTDPTNDVVSGTTACALALFATKKSARAMVIASVSYVCTGPAIEMLIYSFKTKGNDSLGNDRNMLEILS